MASHEYPRGEFVGDVVVVIFYMSLFLFVDAPTVFYATITMIWLLYALARALSRYKNVGYTVFGLVFVALFTAIAISSIKWVGDAAEWSRLVLLTTGIVVYRPLDNWYRTRFLTSKI